MPRATVSRETVKHNLKSVPGGYVELKTLSFDQMLERRDNAMRMSQQISQGNSQSVQVDLKLANQWATHFEFKNCIVDHNLTGESEEKLDFSDPYTLKVLDPKAGAEIQRYLDELNKEEDDESGDFPDVPISSLSPVQNGQKESSEES